MELFDTDAEGSSGRWLATLAAFDALVQRTLDATHMTQPLFDAARLEGAMHAAPANSVAAGRNAMNLRNGSQRFFA